jgi:FMN phosphatase YigB (HAD superfamily)
MNASFASPREIKTSEISELAQALKGPADVVFVDFGGVLCHYVPTQACRTIEAEFDVSGNLTRWLFDHPASWRGIVGRISALEVLQGLADREGLSLRRVQEIWSTFESANVVDLTLIEELQRYRDRVKIFVLSNHWSNGREFFMSKIPKGAVDGMFVSADLGMKKPDPELWDYLAQLLDRSPRAMMLLDDEEENVMGAMDAGLAAYLWVHH